MKVKLKTPANKAGKKSPDWIEDTPPEYLKKVRHNPLEKLWLKIARKR